MQLFCFWLCGWAVYYGFYKPSRTFKCCPEDPGLNPGSEIFFSDEKGLTNSGLRDGMATSLVLDFFYLYRGARLCNLQWLTLFLCFYLMPERIKKHMMGFEAGWASITSKCSVFISWPLGPLQPCCIIIKNNPSSFFCRNKTGFIDIIQPLLTFLWAAWSISLSNIELGSLRY